MRRSTALILLIILCLSVAGSLHAKNEEGDGTSGRDWLFRPAVTRTPSFENCVHKYNNLIVHVSNWGFFGGESGEFEDCEDGELYRSGEFPAGSNIEYLFVGALWIGAVVGEDTLVSVGSDGWENPSVNEMWPCAEPDCGIEIRSSRPADIHYHPDAKSDLEFISVYTDTLTDRTWVRQDPTDLRQHIPIGIEIRQTSYSWAVEYAQDFILLDFSIKNIGDRDIDNLYLGLYSDGDVGHISRELNRYLDDICGFIETVPSRAGQGHIDTINTTYIFDNDGDPSTDGIYDYASCTGVLGTRVMRAPGGNRKVSFNWWQSSAPQVQYDWGPMLDATRRDFGTGGQGTPMGDKNKYYMLSNGEQDYVQLYAAEDFSDLGWLPPAPVASQIANGGDTRYLLSYGPFDITVGDSLNLTCAYVAGEVLHRDPTANETYMEQQPPDADGFLERLDFSDMSDNAVWAAWVYDNPGYDTDGDGFAGYFWEIEDTLPNGEIVIDTFWYAGDGVPDFRAATAPPPPVLRYSTEVGTVKLRWNGLITETAVDPFTKEADFEGYKVYMGRVRTISGMAMVESRDFLDYKRFYWDPDRGRWITFGLPLTLRELQETYDESFDPEDWPCDGPGFVPPGETVSYCFEPVDWNQSIEGWEDGAFVGQTTGIRKRFADEIMRGEVTSDLDSSNTSNWITDIDPITGDSVIYHKYWEYEFSIDDILTSVPWHFSVTAFDFGDFANNLESMESSPLANVVEVWAMNDAAAVSRLGLDPQVYPNPYYGDGRYLDAGYEDPTGTGFIDRSRQIHFINLPYRCKIKIYTLSGDLVKQLEHPGTGSDTDARVHWNMRSQHNELISSGIYLYSVESAAGNYVGKFVIIL